MFGVRCYLLLLRCPIAISVYFLIPSAYSFLMRLSASDFIFLGSHVTALPVFHVVDEVNSSIRS